MHGTTRGCCCFSPIDSAPSVVQRKGDTSEVNFSPFFVLHVSHLLTGSTYDMVCYRRYTYSYTLVGRRRHNHAANVYQVPGITDTNYERPCICLYATSIPGNNNLPQIATPTLLLLHRTTDAPIVFGGTHTHTGPPSAHTR